MSLSDLIPHDKELRYAWHNAVLRASIASQIKQLRKANGWSQRELGRRCGMERARIAVLENPRSKKFPTIRTLSRIASAFDVALIVGFESWGKWLAITADGAIPIPFSREEELLKQEGSA